MSKREPVTFNDGMMDRYRFRFSSLLKNPGLRMQTDKKKNMLLHFTGNSERGTNIFFQYEGEARFAFSPSAGDFSIYIRQVMTIPVVMGPYHNSKLTGGAADKEDFFEFYGETEADKDKVKKRIAAFLGGRLAQEMNATTEELVSANLINKNFCAREDNNKENSTSKSTATDDVGTANAEA